MENSRSTHIDLPCPYCPVCGGPPMYDWPQLTPWLCINVNCDVFGWDPYSSLEHNLMDARPLEVISSVERQGAGPNLKEALADFRWVPCLYDDDVECQHLACQDMEPKD